MKDWALILGSSSGFGAAASYAFAKEGISIFGVHFDRSAAMPAVNEEIERLKKCKVDVKFFNVNAADAAKRAEVIGEIENTFKTGEHNLKVLMHSLAFGTLKPFIGAAFGDGIDQKQLEMTINVMANSLVYWTQEVIYKNLMKEGGKIFAMTSSGGQRVIRFYGAVSAAKAALESHCRQLAMELGSRKIAVNAIRAGVTDTPALRKIPNAEDIIQNALQRNPSNRLTLPEDVAQILVSIVKQTTHWMTGNVIFADGGESVVEL